MKVPRAPHRWSVTPSQATRIQQRLASLVRVMKPCGRLRFVAGVDAAFPGGGTCIGGVVLWDLARHEVVEQHVAMRPLNLPYIAGLLSFREAPALLAALRMLTIEPDVILCDGHGLAHPRRFGVACHVGVITQRPTVGCAKSRLVGSYREPGLERGACAPLRDEGAVLGSVVRTQDSVKPVFVSVGHNIDIRSAVRLVLRCAASFRLPEPIRLADQLVGASRRVP
ncbi:MAG: deoxyribonuclease V [Planctomycetota bacterium]